jgi:Amt family ammonium transporter
VFSYLILKLIDKLIGLRVTADEEMEGLDLVLHEETGYHKL